MIQIFEIKSQLIDSAGRPGQGLASNTHSQAVHDDVMIN